MDEPKIGILELSIAIDYKKIINEGNYEALKQFTNSNDIYGIMDYHYKKLNDELVNLIKGRLGVEFKTSGKFIPYESEQSANENVEAESYDKEEVAKSTMKVIDDAIEDVSINLGMPQTIYLNKKVFEDLKDEFHQLNLMTIEIEDKDEKYSYQGFNLVVDDGIDGLIAIEYKGYGNGSKLSLKKY